jgi:hypothetical protein
VTPTTTDSQHRAHETLRSLGLPEALQAYHPVLAGTVPLGVDIPGSDLDIICQADDLPTFADHLKQLYGDRPGFTVRLTEKQGLPTCICNFNTEQFPLEIFAQPRPAAQQNAVRHMLAEARLLALVGSEASQAREAIRRLKLAGLKTEPAFARHFGLDGDPYETLLHLAGDPLPKPNTDLSPG